MTPKLISIGKLAKATGFSVERLRIWELRYGAPKGERLPSGHRRYAAEEVERLHLVRECIARGKRPRHVVALSREALLDQLDTKSYSHRADLAPRAAHAALPWSTKAWVAAAMKMDEGYLDRQFYEHWLDLGSLRFLRERAEPFIHALGEEWQKGELCVAEEHFGSEKMGDFLAGIWRRLNEHNQAGPVLLTTLPGDGHRLGLQMAALVSAMAGLRVIYLGPNTPVEEVAKAVERVGAKGLLFSAAMGTDQAKAREALLQLRKSLPEPIFIGVGGAGAPLTGDKDKPAWTRFNGLDAFYVWARGWKAGHPMAEQLQETA
jgi:methylmalonyl-CoA mutase cobalamin-binding subunit